MEANYLLLGKVPPWSLAVGRKQAETHSFPEGNHCHGTRGGNRVPPPNTYQAPTQVPRARAGEPGRQPPSTLGGKRQCCPDGTSLCHWSNGHGATDL